MVLAESQEDDRMPVGAPTSSPGVQAESAAVDCRVEHLAGIETGAGSAWATVEAEQVGAKRRLKALTDALQDDIIPRLVQAHGGPVRAPASVSAADVEAFTQQLIHAGDEQLERAVRSAHERGLTATQIYLELFAPAARRMGELWEQDLCDFAGVTVALGRLQRLLRQWTQAFGGDYRSAPNGRRVLLAQHPQEQHSFGLSMVAEFFRRGGWEVLGGVGGSVADPSKQVARDWFDVVGFSIGSEGHVAWAKERIADVRATSRNRAIVVLVGGPLLALHPDWAERVGADASAHDGAQAPAIGERLMAKRGANT
jgi:methanogenic corrinoid protein MtbC1